MTQNIITNRQSYLKDKGPSRVFFYPEKEAVLTWVAYQPLENHVDNVRILMQHWSTDASNDLAIDVKRLDSLVQGAEHHDWGKTEKFTILKKENKTWSYSYSGHRFLHPPEVETKAKKENDLQALYHLQLENAHHDYSVADIVQDTFDLKCKGSTEYTHYPKELFVLEMCDQIEAEVAVMAIEGKQVGRNSSFMEFEVSRPKDADSYGTHQTFLLTPFPFNGSEVTYQLHYRQDELLQQPVSEKELKERGYADYAGFKTLRITLKPQATDIKGATSDIGEFYQTARGFTPNSLQHEVWGKCSGDAPVGLIVKAPTGVGKTEACVYPFLNQGKRTVLILPAKALVDDHAQRFKVVLQTLSEKDRGQRRLLIDTGDTTELYQYPQAGFEEPRRDSRHLYRADVIITTLDKFLYRFFGYGGGKKSYIYPLRLGDRSRMAFVFDEAHSYEGTAFANFRQLVNALYDHEHRIVLMTATLPENYQKALQDAGELGFSGRWDVLDFTTEAKQGELIQAHNQPYYSQRHFTFLPDSPDETVLSPAEEQSFEARQEAFTEHKKQRVNQILARIHKHHPSSERIIVTLDRVQDAAEVYQALREQGLPTLAIQHSADGDSDHSANVQLFLYHGRLDRTWRSHVYATLKARDEAKKPYILVSTSAIEIGVDLDAQVLITEICNPDSLIQRMGRCNRRGKEAHAHVVVIGSRIPEYLDAFGEHYDAYKQYLDRLETWHDKRVGKRFALELLENFPKPVLTDPRAITAFDMLHRYIYDFELEYRNLHDLGFIATRSWEPALEVLIPKPECGDTRYDQLKDDDYDRVQVPVTRLANRGEDACCVEIERLTFEQNSDSSHVKSTWQPVKYGDDLYKNTYRIKALPDTDISQNYQRDLGLVNLPKVFKQERWSQDPPLRVRLRTWLYQREEKKEGAGVMFFASETQPDGKVKAKKHLVFTYLADPILDE